MTEIKIGRDSATGLLRLTMGTKTTVVKEAPPCSAGVGREHAVLTVGDDGLMVVRNLNIENDLYVNGIGVESKRVTVSDNIEMGRERYRLPWDILQPLLPTFADISPLQQVWDDYESRSLKLEISERRFGVLRSATGLITMAAIMLSIFAGRNVLYIVLYALAGLISVAFFIVAYLSASRIPQQRRQLRQQAEEHYCCPVCGGHFTLQKFEQLRQSKRCHNCGALFKN